jgi:phosphopantothenoylcysteine decarboxylase/phosphopantothenate--cysteine ligase
VLGVTGSIAAYKAVALASALTQAQAVVDVILTREATALVQPLSFQAITHRPALTDMFHLLAETEIGHVTLGHEADVVVVAPATAHTIARLALGLADDLLATTPAAAPGHAAAPRHAARARRPHRGARPRAPRVGAQRPGPPGRARGHPGHHPTGAGPARRPSGLAGRRHCRRHARPRRATGARRPR